MSWRESQSPFVDNDSKAEGRCVVTKLKALAEGVWTSPCCGLFSPLSCHWPLFIPFWYPRIPGVSPQLRGATINVLTTQRVLWSTWNVDTKEQGHVGVHVGSIQPPVRSTCSTWEIWIPLFTASIDIDITQCIGWALAKENTYFCQYSMYPSILIDSSTIKEPTIFGVFHLGNDPDARGMDRPQECETSTPKGPLQ